MKSMFTRFGACLMAVMLLLSMTACSFLSPNEIHDTGLDSFSVDASERGITVCLLPAEDFMEKYAHGSGDYHYFDNCFMNEQALETGFVYLEYEETVYAEAKQYCLDNMKLSAVNTKEYHGYIFAENEALTQELKSEDGKDLNYPRYFSMFGYNDSLNRLVFISIFCGDDHAEKAALADSDFGAFLKEFYGEYYDFDANA